MGESLEWAKGCARAIKQCLIGKEQYVAKAQGYLDGSHPIVLAVVVILVNTVAILLGRVLSVYHVLMVTVALNSIRRLVAPVLLLIVKCLPSFAPTSAYEIDKVAAFVATSGWYARTIGSGTRGTKLFSVMVRVFVLTFVFYVIARVSDRLVCVVALNVLLFTPLVVGVDWDAVSEKVSQWGASFGNAVAERTAPARKAIGDQVTGSWNALMAKLRPAEKKEA